MSAGPDFEANKAARDTIWSETAFVAEYLRLKREVRVAIKVRLLKAHERSIWESVEEHGRFQYRHSAFTPLEAVDFDSLSIPLGARTDSTGKRRMRAYRRWRQAQIDGRPG